MCLLELRNRSLHIKRYQLQLCHLLYGVSNAFGSLTAVFHTAIRHMIHSERRNIINDYTAGLKFTGSLKSALDVRGIHPAIKP